jgi:hypothetical protein
MLPNVSCSIAALAAALLVLAIPAGAGEEPDVSGPAEVVLTHVIAEFHEATRLYPDLNPVRTDLLMRLVCMRAAAIRDVDYPLLVMLAGHGTSFAYHPTKYYLYSPPDSPDDTERRLQAGTGCRWEWPPKPKDAEGAWRLVRESVAAGTPVKGSWRDDYIFCGYRDAARPEDRQVYALGGWREPGWMSWGDFAQWFGEVGQMSRVGGQTPRRPEAETALQLMQRTVSWAAGDGRREVSWMKDGAFGLPGIEAYAADVADATKPPAFFDDGYLCCHAVNRQTSGRRCAELYFRHVARLFPAAAAAHMRAAGEHYGRAYRAWGDYRAAFLPPGAATDLAATHLAWSDRARRTAGASAIREAATHEEAAVAELNAALELAASDRANAAPRGVPVSRPTLRFVR